ncbi:hypothetical protein B0X71_13785 [Planococcus lenghuensis]|uniref:Uncharacterized protein n=1 Tax=Planococcus lenghuensis TaxID=2213202 RepID=A0A1Q2L0S9_9BACL|nr:hypothetical protein B0X71_13785 [Planococcus lenghuensis]
MQLARQDVALPAARACAELTRALKPEWISALRFPAGVSDVCSIFFAVKNQHYSLTEPLIY